MGSNDDRRGNEMIGREFVKRLRLLHGRTDTVRTRFELDKARGWVEHVTIETHDKRSVAPIATLRDAEPPSRR
jgi:hypothetical protein